MRGALQRSSDAISASGWALLALGLDFYLLLRETAGDPTGGAVFAAARHLTPTLAKGVISSGHHNRGLGLKTGESRGLD